MTPHDLDLARYLLERGLCDQNALEQACIHQARANAAGHRMSLDEALRDLGLIDSARYQEAMNGFSTLGSTTLTGLFEENPPSPETSSDPEPAKSAERPRTFGEYEVLSEIGRGAMGIVYRARHRRLPEREVALKVFPKESEDLAVRFRREARSLAALDHSGIVAIYAFGELEGFLYFAMELVEGRDLSKRLAAAPMGLSEGLRLMATLCDAVQHIHDAGMIHRDIKPQNVLLTPSGQPKLTDFGLAKSLDGKTRLTRTGTVLGTPFYMAPEQISGLSHRIDERTDVYALGVLLYQLVTGRLPFDADKPGKLIRLVTKEAPPPPTTLRPHLPASVEAICLRALEKENRKRYPSAGAMADDLRQVLDGEAPVVRPKPGLSLLFGALFLGLVGLLFFFLPDGTGPAVERENVRENGTETVASPIGSRLRALSFERGPAPFRSALDEIGRLPDLPRRLTFLLARRTFDLFEKTRDSSDGRKALERLEPLDPDPPVRLLEARIRRRLGDAEGALRSLRSLTGNQLEVLTETARAQIALRLFEAAGRTIDRLQAPYPRTAKTLRLLLRVARTDDRYAAGSRRWDLARSNEAERNAVRTWAEARVAYRQILADLAGTERHLLLTRARLLRRLGELVRALETLEEAEADHSSDLPFILELADLYLLNRHPADARLRYERVLHMARDIDLQVRALRGLAALEFCMGRDWKVVRARYQEVRALKPYHPFVLRDLTLGDLGARKPMGELRARLEDLPPETEEHPAVLLVDLFLRSLKPGSQEVAQEVSQALNLHNRDPDLLSLHGTVTQDERSLHRSRHVGNSPFRESWRYFERGRFEIEKARRTLLGFGLDPLVTSVPPSELKKKAPRRPCQNARYDSWLARNGFVRRGAAYALEYLARKYQGERSGELLRVLVWGRLFDPMSPLPALLGAIELRLEDLPRSPGPETNAMGLVSSMGELDRAERFRGDRLHPSYIPYHRGMLRLGRGHSDHAVTRLGQAWSLRPRPTWTWGRNEGQKRVDRLYGEPYAKALQRKGKAEQAEAIRERLSPRGYTAYVRELKARFDAALNLPSVDDRLAQLNDIIALEPYDAHLRRRLADALLQASPPQLEQSHVHWLASFEFAPARLLGLMEGNGNAPVHRLRFSELKAFFAGQGTFRREGLRHFVPVLEAYIGLEQGDDLKEADLEEAIFHATQYIRIHPTLPTIHVLRGALHRHLGYIDQARDDLRRARFLAPRDPAPSFERARLLKETGQPKEQVVEALVRAACLGYLRPDHLRMVFGESIAGAVRRRWERSPERLPLDSEPLPSRHRW